MSPFGLFKPDIEGMKRRGDIGGLIKALGHKDNTIQAMAGAAARRRYWRRRTKAFRRQHGRLYRSTLAPVLRSYWSSESRSF